MMVAKMLLLCEQRIKIYRIKKKSFSYRIPHSNYSRRLSCALCSWCYPLVIMWCLMINLYCVCTREDWNATPVAVALFSVSRQAYIKETRIKLQARILWKKRSLTTHNDVALGNGFFSSLSRRLPSSCDVLAMIVVDLSGQHVKSKKWRKLVVDAQKGKKCELGKSKEDKIFRRFISKFLL